MKETLDFINSMKIHQVPLVKHAKKIVFALLLALAAYILFINLGKFPLENWDEAWYGDIVRYMLRTKEFIIPYWNQQIFIDKPPLYLWITALIASFFGLNEFTLRITSAVCAFIIIAIVTDWSFKKYGILSAIFAFSTLALNNIFIWRARSGNLDLLTTLLIFLSYFCIISKDKQRYVWLGVVFGLTFLTKASIVIYPIFIFILYELIYQRKHLRNNLSGYFNLILICSLLSGGWLFLAYLKEGSHFVQYFLFSADQGVGTVGLSKWNVEYIKFTYYALQRRFFWIFLIGLVFMIRDIKKPQFFTLFLFASLLIVQLSFTERTNNWYLTPAMPFWSMVVAYGLHEIINIFPKKLRIPVALGVLTVGLYISYKTLMVNILYLHNSTSITKLVESARKLNQLTKKNDVIMRLDDLYPTTVYYSDRKILPITFYRKDQVILVMKSFNVRWFAGTKEEVNDFISEYKITPVQIIKVNDEEIIIRI